MLVVIKVLPEETSGHRTLLMFCVFSHAKKFDISISIRIIIYQNSNKNIHNAQKMTRPFRVFSTYALYYDHLTMNEKESERETPEKVLAV